MKYFVSIAGWAVISASLSGTTYAQDCSTGTCVFPRVRMQVQNVSNALASIPDRAAQRTVLLETNCQQVSMESGSTHTSQYSMRYSESAVRNRSRLVPQVGRMLRTSRTLCRRVIAVPVYAVTRTRPRIRAALCGNR